MIPELFRLIYLGKFDQLDLVFRDQGEKDLEAYVLYLDQLGRFDEAFEVLNRSDLPHGGILEGHLWWRKGDMEAANAAIDTIAPENIESKFWMSFWYNVAGNIAWRQGDYHVSIELHQQSLALRRSLEFAPLVTLSLNNIGTSFYSQGWNKEAHNYFTQALDSIGDEFNPNVKGAVLNNIASLHSSMGDLPMAMEYNLKGLELKKQLGNSEEIAYSLNNLGLICYKMGDMSQAQQYFQKALDIRLQLGNPSHLVITYANLARMHYDQRRLDQSYDLVSHCLNLLEDSNDQLILAELYYWMVKILLKLDRPQEAESYLKLLTELDPSNPVVANYQDITHAVFLLSQPRMAQKVRAVPYLDKLLSGEVTRHDLFVSALLARCEVLLYDYKLSGDDIIFNQISTELDRLYQTAQDQQSHSLVIETILLKSRFLLLQGSYSDLDLVLEQALFYAKDRGLWLLAQRVEEERELVLKEFTKLKQAPVSKAVEKDTLAYLEMVRAFLDSR